MEIRLRAQQDFPILQMVVKIKQDLDHTREKESSISLFHLYFYAICGYATCIKILSNNMPSYTCTTTKIQGSVALHISLLQVTSIFIGYHQFV